MKGPPRGDTARLPQLGPDAAEISPPDRVPLPQAGRALAVCTLLVPDKPTERGHVLRPVPVTDSEAEAE